MLLVQIKLSKVGHSFVSFDLYSDVDSYSVPFETNIKKINLIVGYNSFFVPDNAKIIRVKSNDVYIDLEIIGFPTTTTTTTTLPLTTTTTTLSPFTTTTTTLPQGLILTFDDIANANLLVGDSSDVNDWNTFFQLPYNGDVFDSVHISGNNINLLGGGNRVFVTSVFIGSTNGLLGVYDSLPTISGLGNSCFSGSMIKSVYAPLCTYIGFECFSECYDLTSIYIPSCDDLGGSVLSTNVFAGIIGNSISLTIPTTLMTCNSGQPDEDIQYLIDNNTMTIYDPQGNLLYPYSLKLTFNDITSADLLIGGNSSNINNWNIFFDLPTNGNPFTNIMVSGNEISLIGGSNISLQNTFSRAENDILSIYDTGCVSTVNSYSFNYNIEGASVGFSMLTSVHLEKATLVESSGFIYTPSLVTVSLPSVTSIGDNAFVNTPLTELDIRSCVSLGTTTGYDNVLYNFQARVMSITISPILMTCNGDAPDGDIQWLIDNNTVTINYINKIFAFSLTTESTEPAWQINNIVNNGLDLYWEVTGAVTTTAFGNTPSFDFSNEGVKTVNVYSFDSVENITSFTAEYGNTNFLTLDVSNLVNLTYLGCTSNKLISLDVSNLVNLAELQCNDNQLTSLDVSNLVNLTGLNCSDNPSLSSLILGNISNLYYIWCSNCQLISLDVSNLVNLDDLMCDGNLLTILDVSNATNLSSIFCINNQLTALDVTNLTQLTGLYISDNNISTIDLSNNSFISDLILSNTLISTLDISNLNLLFRLNISNNYLSSVNINQILDQIISFNRSGHLFDSRNQNTIAYVDANKVAALDLLWDEVYADIEPVSLKLTFNDLNNADLLIGGSSSNVNDWNIFFDLPVNGTPFTSVDITGTEVSLIGGSNIHLKDSLFDDIIGYGTSLLTCIDTGSVISVGDGVFGAALNSGANNITTVSFNNLVTIGNDCFSYLPNLVNVNIPLATSLGNYCFGGCELLNNIDFSSVETMGNQCFSSCIGLLNINLPALTTIGDNTFDGCIILNSVNLPILNIMGINTFAGCSDLTLISLPSIINLPDYTFGQCIGLTSIDLPICTQLGSTLDFDDVFGGISGNDITLTIPTALMSCNGGLPDGDINYLTNNNTVTFIYSDADACGCLFGTPTLI
jgi:Leucine-rich repeat (LRR) protein